MKRRLNILCLLVFITVSIGFLPFLYAVGIGFQTGVEGNHNQSVELDQYVEAASVNLMPARFVGLSHGTIINKVMEVGDKITKAPYLNKIHQVIDGIDVFDYLSDDEMNRLKLLSSVLKQKWG